MEYRIFVNNPWQENTVVLYDDSGEAVVIDCGCLFDRERSAISRFFEERKINPVCLLNTHLHLDHIFGNGFMLETYGLRTRASAEDIFLLEHFAEQTDFLGISGADVPPEPGQELKDGDKVVFGNTELRVIAVPGHSPGSLCYYAEAHRLLVAGDVLFRGSIGRTDLERGNGEELIRGIKTRLFVLPEDVVVIPGHGPNTTIGYEKKYNPFFYE